MTTKIFTVLMLVLLLGCEKEVTSTRNTSLLEELIDEAAQYAANAEEGPEPGLYPVGAAGLLQAAIDSANKLVENSVTQFAIDQAEIVVQNAIDQFLSSIQEEKQLYFDGSGYLNGGSATPYNTNYITLQAWIYPTEWKNAMYIISTEGQNTGYKLQVPSGKPTFVIGTGSSSVSLASSTAISLDTWTHVTATFDGSKMRIFVNGVQATEKSLSYKIVDNGENFRIGEGSKYTSRTFKGRIRDVRIWDYALTNEEITSSMTDKPTGTETGLTAWWPFNVSSGSTIVDRTGNHSLDAINIIYVDPI